MGKKLLVADDSLTIQKVIKLALSSEGYDILAVSEGKEAIKAIQEERPDVVLIDVALPGADAYVVKRAINQNPNLRHIGFVLMASAFEKVDEKAVDETGFQARLIKPFDPSHLRKAVADLMNGGAATIAPPPPPEENEEEQEGEDMPPVMDMHPTVSDEAPAASVTEEEFKLELPILEVKETPEPVPVPVIPPKPNLVGGTGSFAPPPPPMIETESDATDEAEERESAAELENDIKDLTESTIKMSGLDEFQWNLDDSKKMKKGAAAPPPPDKTKEIQRSVLENNTAKPTIGGLPTRAIDDGGSSFPLKGMGQQAGKPANAAQTMRQNLQQAPKPPSGADLVSSREYTVPTIELQQAEPVPARAAAPPITRAEIEEIVRKDVQAVIEKLAREIVPQIAEAVIRAEIEKILSEN